MVDLLVAVHVRGRAIVGIVYCVLSSTCTDRRLPTRTHARAQSRKHAQTHTTHQTPHTTHYFISLGCHSLRASRHLTLRASRPSFLLECLHSFCIGCMLHVARLAFQVSTSFPGSTWHVAREALCCIRDGVFGGHLLPRRTNLYH